MDNGKNDPRSERLLAAAIEVHRELGPGFMESLYEEALSIALRGAGLSFRRQTIVPIYFRGYQVGEHRLDLLVEDWAVIELKAIAAFQDVHFAIVRSYLRATGLQCGFLLNFAAPTLQIKRVGPHFYGGGA